MDEMNKNNREDNRNISSGAMSAKPGDNCCPVLSFKLYLSKLIDKCERLWQRPKDSFVDSFAPLGDKSLSSYMTRISYVLNLLTRYTYHSMRATGATLLSRANYNNAQIMSVTGQKSVSSLSLYQRISNNEKMSMGDTLAKSLRQQINNAQYQLQRLL